MAHSAYNSWDIFQKEFCRQGGIIEGMQLLILIYYIKLY